MCGINGFLNQTGVALADPEGYVAAMNRALAHRGPDDEGAWHDPDRGVHLGHRRLSILDLSAAGHQPMQTPRGTTIVFNGEVYNFRELKRDLLVGERFASHTDTEVLLRLYERDGEGMLEHLNGMFAFALWDPDRGGLFLARDRVGIKPLYYTQQGGVFAFSSEIRALLTLPWVNAALDEEALYHFLTYTKVMPPRTMFEGIYKLRPGHKLFVRPGGPVAPEPYWEVAYENLDREPEAALQDRLLDGLRQSVGYRMISDVPVGAFLSGGVDSSAIVALMAERAAHPIKTYSVGFEGAPDYDELDPARRVSALFGTDHHERVVTAQDIRDFLPRIVEIYDEPLADATSIPIHFISQMARREGTTVVLTGDGADELFSGYRNWQRYVRLYPYYRAFARLPRPLKRLAAGAYRAYDAGSPNAEILARAADDQEFFWGGARGFKESVKRDFLSPAYSARVAHLDSYDEMLGFRRRFEAVGMNGRRRRDVDWMCYLGAKSIVPDYYLYRADRLGMANSIELRVPFLDHHLVNYALSLPGGLKVRDGEPKYVLKKALEAILPRDVLYRKKMGFCVPLQEWAGEIMVDYLEREGAAFCERTGVFSEAGLRRQLDAARAGSAHYTSTLWSVYFLASWINRWIP